MHLLNRAGWPASLERISNHERGTLVTVRHQPAPGEPGLVVIWRLPLHGVFLDGEGALVIVTGHDSPITVQGATPLRLFVGATVDRRQLHRLRAECDDGSAITIEFLHE